MIKKIGKTKYIIILNLDCINSVKNKKTKVFKFKNKITKLVHDKLM